MRVVEVAVSAKRPSVMVDQIRDQTGFVAFVKPYWTGVRRRFWTAISCCRHRYARIESRALAMLHHQKECMWIRIGCVQSASRPYWRTCGNLTLVSIYDNPYTL